VGLVEGEIMAWEREKGYGPEDIATGKYFESIEDAYDHAYSLLERFSDPLPRLPISTLEMDATYNFKTHRWGLRDFHLLSFGAGFLLSSLFWLTIGIAFQIISR
jgi:hypothetical protein